MIVSVSLNNANNEDNTGQLESKAIGHQGDPNVYCINYTEPSQNTTNFPKHLGSASQNPNPNSNVLAPVIKPRRWIPR